MTKINIIQFLPYFPPHKGGLETHAQQWSNWWIKKGYGEVLNITFSVGQDKNSKFKIQNSKLLVIPAFDLIPNFPFPKFWKKEYWQILKETKKFSNTGKTIMITRTRFFLSSLIGGVIAKKNKIKWVHIEHGSGFVKLSSIWKNLLAYIYDKLIGKWIFKNANLLIGVSRACKNFIQKEFINRKVEVIYRGLEIDKEILNKKGTLKNKFKNKIIIGFVGRLYKWKNVDSLVSSYYKLEDDLKEKIQIVIVGDGEDLDKLKNLDIENKIHFTGSKSFDEAILLQNDFDIHIHTSAPGGGLATTLLQAMKLGCLIVATPYEGADEVIKNDYNGILLENCGIVDLKKGMELAVKNLNKKDKWGKVNIKIIKDEFEWDRNIEKYYSTYGKL